MGDIYNFTQLRRLRVVVYGGGTSLTLGIAVFIFAFGFLNNIHAQDSQNPLSSLSSNRQEVHADNNTGSMPPQLAASHIFLSSTAQQASSAPVLFAGIGGANPEPSLATSQHTALIGYNPPLTTAVSQNQRTKIVKYVVREGDSPSVIAAAYGITTNTLLWSNDLGSYDYIRPGDELTILPVSGTLHSVRSGDTVSSIAKRYGVRSDKILIYNDIDPDANIVVGQTLIVPGGTITTASYTSSYTPTFNSLPNILGYFITPTAGSITQGLHGYNAVDIGGGCWEPIWAAASGTVEIASGVGRWNGGYGNFVKIKHPNGLQTLYSHMIEVSIYAGNNVNQGQIIGYTGSTGRSSGCHLHWEVRGAKNPLARY